MWAPQGRVCGSGQRNVFFLPAPPPNKSYFTFYFFHIHLFIFFEDYTVSENTTKLPCAAPPRQIGKKGIVGMGDFGKGRVNHLDTIGHPSDTALKTQRQLPPPTP